MKHLLNGLLLTCLVFFAVHAEDADPDPWVVVRVSTEYEDDYRVLRQSGVEAVRKKAGEEEAARLAKWKADKDEMDRMNANLKSQMKMAVPKPKSSVKILKKHVSEDDAREQCKGLVAKASECGFILVTVKSGFDGSIGHAIETVLKSNMTRRLKQIRQATKNELALYTGKDGSRPMSSPTTSKAKALSGRVADAEAAQAIFLHCRELMLAGNPKLETHLRKSDNPMVKSYLTGGTLGTTAFTGAFGDAMKAAAKGEGVQPAED